MLCHGVQSGVVSKMLETEQTTKDSLIEIEENKQFAKPIASSLSGSEHRPVPPTFLALATTPRLATPPPVPKKSIACRIPQEEEN